MHPNEMNHSISFIFMYTLKHCNMKAKKQVFSKSFLLTSRFEISQLFDVDNHLRDTRSLMFNFFEHIILVL